MVFSYFVKGENLIETQVLLLNGLDSYFVPLHWANVYV